MVQLHTLVRFSAAVWTGPSLDKRPGEAHDRFSLEHQHQFHVKWVKSKVIMTITVTFQAKVHLKKSKIIIIFSFFPYINCSNNRLYVLLQLKYSLLLFGILQLNLLNIPHRLFIFYGQHASFLICKRVSQLSKMYIVCMCEKTPYTHTHTHTGLQLAGMTC